MTKRNATTRHRTKGRRRFEKARALAKVKIEPWPQDASGPSHETWGKWNNEHGMMLRIAVGVMTLSKEKLAGLAADQEVWQQTVDGLTTALKFFRDMAEVIDAAQTRLLVGAAVYATELEKRSKKAA